MYVANTQNRSFVKMSERLLLKSVNNYEFMLKVYDPDLVDFDLDSYLQLIHGTDESVARLAYNTIGQKITEEVKNNIWFFFREILRVNNGMNQFHLTEKSMRMIFAYANGKNVIDFSGDRGDGQTTTLIALSIYDEYVRFFKEENADTPSKRIFFVENECSKWGDNKQKYLDIVGFLYKNELPCIYTSIGGFENIGGGHLDPFFVVNSSNDNEYTTLLDMIRTSPNMSSYEIDSANHLMLVYDSIFEERNYLNYSNFLEIWEMLEKQNSKIQILLCYRDILPNKHSIIRRVFKMCATSTNLVIGWNNSFYEPEYIPATKNIVIDD